MKTQEMAVEADRGTLTACILDDDPAQVEMLQATLEHFGCSAVGTTDPKEALDLISDGRCGVVLSDLKMPEMDGLQFLQKALQRDPGIPVILLTGFYTVDSAIEAIKRGAYDYLCKPVERARLKKTLDEIRETYGRRRRVREISEQLLSCSEISRTRRRRP